MAARRCAPAERHAGLARCGDDKLAANKSGNRRTVVSGNRQIYCHASVAGPKIALPSAIRHDIPASHKITIACMRRCNRIVRCGCVVKKFDRAHIPAIAVVEKDTTVRLAHFHRLYDREVGRVLDQSVGVPGALSKSTI